MSKRDRSTVKPSDFRRSPGISYQEILDKDSRPVPGHLRNDTSVFLGDHDVPVDRYIDPKFHELEKERLWKKVWQMALREERIPNVGDTDVYEINDVSIILVRVAPDTIKGYYNACLHMGRQLVDRPCNMKEIRCPYHGFTWQTNGKLKHIPSMWDFPHVDAKKFNLPEVKVATWGGFVFINMDPNCEPLEDFLEGLDEHFTKYPLSERYTAAHVKKVLRCNWKVAQEAFMDGYHLIGTHPQILVSTGDENSQYDVFGNFSRGITATGTPSPHLKWSPTEDDMAASAFNPGDPAAVLGPPKIPAGSTYRKHTAHMVRESLRPVIGTKADALSDAELIDSFYYTVFPNFHPWLAYNTVLQHFMPYGDRHDMCTMEIMYLLPFKGERPPPAKMRFLGPDERFLEATELGETAAIADQDDWNVAKVQRGLETLRLNKPGITMGIYQHSQVRHFHNIYDRWMGLEKGPKVRKAPKSTKVSKAKKATAKRKKKRK